MQVDATIDMMLLGHVNPLYRETLKHFVLNLSHEKTIPDHEEFCKIQINAENVDLVVSIHPEEHRIRDAAYTGAIPLPQKCIFEAFCQLILGLPIQEAKDHGVQRLEYSLRNKKFPPPVPGIVNIFNLDPLFHLPKQMIRDVLQDYSERYGYAETQNNWSVPISDAWRALTDEERIAKLQQFFDSLSEDDLGKNRKLHIVRIDQKVKVHVEFRDAVSPGEKAKALFDLEPIARWRLEPGIQLYLEPAKDKNRLRSL